MSSGSNYLVCGVGPWSRAAFDQHHGKDRLVDTRWHFLSDPRRLAGTVRRLRPRYVFFLHWRWKIPPAIYLTRECVGFHMTDLPYGRGGSPLQNLILAGKRTTKISAFRVTGEMDSGPLYMQHGPINLAHGDAQGLYRLVAQIAVGMAVEIATNAPTPKPQRPRKPTDVVFKRRAPVDSQLPSPPNLSPRQLYDVIRMTDAEGYQPAFYPWYDWQMEFRDASISDKTVTAVVTFKKRTL